MSQVDQETHLKLLRLLESDPQVSQRALAGHLGVSLGKTNYCLQGLMEKGWLKARSFKNSNNKIAYAYVLTPKGLSGKARLTSRFLQRKVREYEMLKGEIEQLRQEVSRCS